MVVVTRDVGLEYPVAKGPFSPDQSFSEYRFSHLSDAPNGVYRMFREMLRTAGLDTKTYGKSDWNPLGAYIKPASKVFVLCNFVFHRRAAESQGEFHAKCIHGSVLRALIDYVLIAVGEKGKVTFGNAPLQSCDWNLVVSDTGASDVLRFYETVSRDVTSRDLRQFITRVSGLGRIMEVVPRSGEDAIEVELGADSLLNELYDTNKENPRFRVSDYDPSRTESFHGLDHHRYLINREILESDVVINLSKLKTHEKVGITCGLKGFVGTVAHKDCLAHHRFGGPQTSGDEYPQDSSLKHAFSRFHDFVYRSNYPAVLAAPFHVLDKNISRIRRLSGEITVGAWHGNDTAWRMSLDIARIVRYSDKHGNLNEVPQRCLLSVIDGVVGGEGNGPLAPRPVNAGVLVFSDNIAFGDRAACRLMGFNPNDIPIVREAFRPMRFDMGAGSQEITTIVSGEEIREDDIQPVLSRPFEPPRGWKRYLLRKQ